MATVFIIIWCLAVHCEALANTVEATLRLRMALHIVIIGYTQDCNLTYPNHKPRTLIITLLHSLSGIGVIRFPADDTSLAAVFNLDWRWLGRTSDAPAKTKLQLSQLSSLLTTSAQNGNQGWTRHVDWYGHCLGPSVGSGVVRIDPLRFLAGCCTRRLNQALSDLFLSLSFFWVRMFCC